MTINTAALQALLNAAIASNSAVTAIVGEDVGLKATQAADDLVSMLTSASPADFGWSHGVASISGSFATVDVYPANNTRPSLDQLDYPSGAIDLVDILDQGYSASGPVYGVWDGEEIRSRTVFAGANFLEPTISSFAKSHPEVSVTLNR